MPYRELATEGVTVGQGTDNDRDYVILHGTADQLEGAMVQANKLLVDNRSTPEYRWYASNSGLQLLWRMITSESAALVGNTQYGIAEGVPADLVVFDRPSPEWAIATQATKRYVIKNGNIVAQDGEILPEYRVVDDYDDVLASPIN
jgi:cytosine/adenosine deaminase-related metal-dependent hydrolase